MVIIHTNRIFSERLPLSFFQRFMDGKYFQRADERVILILCDKTDSPAKKHTADRRSHVHRLWRRYAQNCGRRCVQSWANDNACNLRGPCCIICVKLATILDTLFCFGPVPSAQILSLDILRERRGMLKIFSGAEDEPNDRKCTLSSSPPPPKFISSRRRTKKFPARSLS